MSFKSPLPPPSLDEHDVLSSKSGAYHSHGHLIPRLSHLHHRRHRHLLHPRPAQAGGRPRQNRGRHQGWAGSGLYRLSRGPLAPARPPDLVCDVLFYAVPSGPGLRVCPVGDSAHRLL